MRRMWGDLVHDDDMDKLETFYAKSLRGEGGVILEYRVRCGGEERWVSHSWSPIVKDGEVWQVVSAVNDITWRKNAETAQECFAIFLKKNYDLLMLDYNLGDVNGIGILEKLKELDVMVPIVMVTQQKDPKIAIDAMKLGAPWTSL